MKKKKLRTNKYIGVKIRKVQLSHVLVILTNFSVFVLIQFPCELQEFSAGYLHIVWLLIQSAVEQKILVLFHVTGILPGLGLITVHDTTYMTYKG